MLAGALRSRMFIQQATLLQPPAKYHDEEHGDRAVETKNQIGNKILHREVTLDSFEGYDYAAVFGQKHKQPRQFLRAVCV